MCLLLATPAMAQTDTTSTYDSGKPRFEGQMKNGQRHGKWTWYYPSGELKKVEHYDAGQRNGLVCDYRPQSEAKQLNEDTDVLYKPVTIKRFNQGELVLEQRIYAGGGDTLRVYEMAVSGNSKRITKRYDNGQLQTIEEFNLSDQEHGISQHWNEKGQLLYDYNYANGKLQRGYKSWYSTGVLKAENAANSNIAVRYYQSGVIEQVTRLDTDCGGEECYTRFYESGRQKKEKVKIGNVVRETTWALDHTIEQHEMDGIYERKSGWFSSGSVWYSGVYFNGSGSMRWWHQNGLPDQVQHYENGARSGTWKYWDADGKLLREEWYEGGKQVKSENY